MTNLQKSGLIWPGIATLLALVVLVWLGNWQMQRLAWKEGLIMRIAQRAKAEPMTLIAADKIWRKTGDIEYLRVRATGRFEHDKESHYFMTQQGRVGWHVFTPLRLADGRAIMVNRGFVSDQHKAAKTRLAGQQNGVFKIVGLLRQPGKKGLFTPDNKIAKNQWYWRDLPGMVAAIEDKTTSRFYPFFLEAGKTSTPQVKEPRAGATRLGLSNKHLGYALTWYGLALALLGVFGVFAWPRLKKATSSP